MLGVTDLNIIVRLLDCNAILCKDRGEILHGEGEAFVFALGLAA